METLVAIFILLISVTGPMAFSQNGLRAAFQSRDQITAFYLAQDAIEYVKNVRDTNVLSDDDWLEGLGGCSDSTNGCSVDTLNEVVDNCPGIGCLGDSEEDDTPLYVDTNGYFVTDSGDDSTFSRTVYITETEDNIEAEVVVKIRWTSHDTIGSREITVVEYMYNWTDGLLN